MAFTRVVFVVFLLGFKFGSGIRIEKKRFTASKYAASRIALEPDSGVQHDISKEGVSTQTSLVDRNEDQKNAEKSESSKSGGWMASLIEYACSRLTSTPNEPWSCGDWCCWRTKTKPKVAEDATQEFIVDRGYDTPGMRPDESPRGMPRVDITGWHSPPMTPRQGGSRLPREPHSPLALPDSPKAFGDRRGEFEPPSPRFDGGRPFEEVYPDTPTPRGQGFGWDGEWDGVQLPLPVPEPLHSPKHFADPRENDLPYVEAPPSPRAAPQKAQLERELQDIQSLLEKIRDPLHVWNSEQEYLETIQRGPELEARARQILALLREMEAGSPLATRFGRKGVEGLRIDTGRNPEAREVSPGTPKSQTPRRPAPLMLPDEAFPQRHNSSPQTPRRPDLDFTPVSSGSYSPWGSDADSNLSTPRSRDSQSPRSQAPHNLSGGTPRFEGGRWAPGTPMSGPWEGQSSAPSEPSTPVRAGAREYAKRAATALYPTRLVKAFTGRRWAENPTEPREPPPSPRTSGIPGQRQAEGPREGQRERQGLLPEGLLPEALTPRSAGDAEALDFIREQILRDEHWRMPEGTEAAQREADRLVKLIEDMEIALWILELEGAERITRKRAGEIQEQYAWYEEYQQNSMAKLATIYKQHRKVEVYLWVYLGCFQIESNKIFPRNVNRVYVDAARHKEPPLQACKKQARDAGSTWFAMEKRLQRSEGDIPRLACAHSSNARLPNSRRIIPRWPEAYYGESFKTCQAEDPCRGEGGPDPIGYMKVWAKAYKEQEVFEPGKIAEAIRQRTTGHTTRKARTLLGQTPNGPWAQVKAK